MTAERAGAVAWEGRRGDLAAKAGGHSGRYLTASVVTVAGTAALSIMVANWFGPEGKGEASLVLTAAILTGSASTLGLELSLCRSIAARVRKGGQAARTAPALLLVVTGLGAILGAIAGAAIGAATDLPTTGAIAATSAIAAATAGTIVSTNLLVAARGSATVLSSRLATSAAMVVVALALLIAGAGLIPVLLVVGATGAACLALQAGAFFRGHGVGRGFDLRGSRPLLASGLRAHSGTVIQSMSYRVDYFIVAALLGTSDLGIYSVAVMLAQLLWFFPDALGMTLLQRVSLLGGDRSALEVLRRASYRALLAMGSLALTLAATAWLIVPIVFGDGFGAAYVPLLILLPGTIALGLWKLGVNYLFAQGHDFSKTRGAAVAAATAVGLDFLLIPEMGVNGAALAATIAYSLAALTALAELYVRERLPAPSLVDGGSS